MQNKINCSLQYAFMVNFHFMLTCTGTYCNILLDACVMNSMRSIPHREQPSRYGQGLDAPIQISKLSLQNWCTRAEEVCFPCPCLPGVLCVCVRVSGECDVLIRAEFLIPGDRAAHPHELNNGCPLQRSSNPQLSKDRTGQSSCDFQPHRSQLGKNLTVQTDVLQFASKTWLGRCVQLIEKKMLFKCSELTVIIT